MKLIRMDHLDIVVSDLAKSVEFYRKFGLSPEGTIDKGETVLHPGAELPEPTADGNGRRA